MEKWLESFARTNFLRSGDTAHDLKTPLNVAVLNLELLRMRIRKLTDSSDDAKLQEYTAAIETELRRMARIFDTFFLLSTPPKGEEGPVLIDAAAICVEAAADAGISVSGNGPSMVVAHEARIRQAFRLFFEAVAKLFPTGILQAAIDRDRHQMTVTVTGNRPAEDFEPTKLFKFYYTDALGNPDLALATARLIFETYGGELNATEESDKVAIRLSLPLGES
jgi:nitrogen fixation/metabolism regulation signal transduction histidine kinase